MNLDELIEEKWEEVRALLYYPQLPPPIVNREIPNAHIRLDSLQTEINDEFVQEFADEHGFDTGDLLQQIFSHEMTHFLYFPGSPAQIFRQTKVALEVEENPEKAQLLRQIFVEVQTNTYVATVLNDPLSVPCMTVLEPQSSLDALTHRLYERLWEADLGMSVEKRDKKYLDQLDRLNYLDQSKELDTLRTFVEVLKDYEELDQEDQGESQSLFSKIINSLTAPIGDLFNKEEAVPGKGSGAEMKEAPIDIDIFPEQEILNGMKEFAGECETEDEYKKVVSAVLGEDVFEESKDGPTQAGQGRSKLHSVPDFYSSWAKKYSVLIQSKPLENNGSLYPYRNEAFSLTDPMTSLNPFSTPGIYPGITKRYEFKEGRSTQSRSEGTPHVIIAVDNSGSMPDPKKKSIPVLAATVIANAYLDKRSEVGVYSFGSDDEIHHLSSDRREIHRNLRKYAGGGTQFRPELFMELLQHQDNPYDVCIVSDMDIDNFSAFLSTLESLPLTNRIHLVCNKDYKTESLENSYGHRENISVMGVYRESDISKVVLGEMQKSF